MTGGNNMNDKMTFLISKMGLNDELKKYSEGSKLYKIQRKENQVKFYINLKTNWPLNIYQEFYTKLKETFNGYDVDLILELEDIDKELFPYYYRYFIEQYSKESSILKMYLDNEFFIQEKVLTIKVSNKAEEMKLETIIENLKQDLKKVGYDLDIKIEIDKKQNQKIEEEIKALKNKSRFRSKNT